MMIKRKNISFKFEGGKIYQTVTFDRCLLRDDVFSAILAQMEDNSKVNIKKLKFYYNSQDITEHFLNNDPVRCLNLPYTSEITVCKLKNILPDSTVILNK